MRHPNRRSSPLIPCLLPPLSLPLGKGEKAPFAKKEMDSFPCQGEEDLSAVALAKVEGGVGLGRSLVRSMNRYVPSLFSHQIISHHEQIHFAGFERAMGIRGGRDNRLPAQIE